MLPFRLTPGPSPHILSEPSNVEDVAVSAIWRIVRILRDHPPHTGQAEVDVNPIGVSVRAQTTI